MALSMEGWSSNYSETACVDSGALKIPHRRVGTGVAAPLLVLEIGILALTGLLRVS